MDPAIKKIRDTFIRKLGDEMRADGFDDKRIAWLLGPEAVAANGNEARNPVVVKREKAPRAGTLALRICQLIANYGPQTVAELSRSVGRAPKDMRPILRSMRHRLFVRSREVGGEVEYRLT